MNQIEIPAKLTYKGIVYRIDYTPRGRLIMTLHEPKKELEYSKAVAESVGVETLCPPVRLKT